VTAHRKTLLSLAVLSVSLSGCPSGRAPAPEPPSFEEEATRTTGRDGDLAIGVTFDSATLEGTADGLRDASDLGVECRGFVLETGVNHVLTLSEARPLTFRATPRGVGVADLFLAVSTDGATWSCTDDSDDLDPVHATMAPSGVVRVLVGTTDDTVVPYTLTITDGLVDDAEIALGDSFGAPVADGEPPVRTTEGTFGGATIPATTAPITFSGHAGGTRRAVDVEPGCVGYVAQTPDHVFEVAAAQPLLFRVRAEGDTTLLIQGPGPEAWCADDEEGLDPVLRIDAVPGRYSVYVGSYDEGDAATYALTVSR
jgi:hypothetical protein